MWKEYLSKVHVRDKDIHFKILTDVSGPGYVIILEIEYQTFAEAEPSQCKLTHQEDWKEFYSKFIPYCESTKRTYYKQQLIF